MSISLGTSSLILPIGIVAALYSAVGHGGASGYLAVLSLLGKPANHEHVAAVALVLNILVSAISLAAYAKAGHFSLKITWPLIIASVPLAFLGGLLKLSDKAYFALLGITLLLAALRMFFFNPAPSQSILTDVSKAKIMAVGGTIGFASGVVGVGGGVFLSPLMLLLKWADVKTTSATAAAFILVNSLAGVAARVSRGGFDVGDATPLIASALIGGLIGSGLGAYVLSRRALCVVLGTVLLIASTKLLIQEVS